MSEESTFESLRDLPRVPRTDDAGIQIGVGGIPPHKKTANYGKPVDYMEAAANMNKRLKGEMPMIPGGIDDNDPALYDPPKTASPFEKMHVAQHGSLTPEQVEMLKRKNSEEPPVEAGGPSKGVECPGAQGVPGVPGVSEVTLPSLVVPTPPPAPVPEVGPQPDAGPNMTYTEYLEKYGEEKKPRRRRSQPPVQVVEKPVYVTKEVPVYKEVEKVVEKEIVKPGPFEEWVTQRIRVQIGMQETSFNISAVAALRSPLGITVILPTSNDAMTFIPRTGAHVTLGIKNEMVNTIFTGVSFDIEELGIMGLCFLVDRKKEET